MLIQEPLHAAIWHCLNHYDYLDATFLAERLYAEVNSDDSVHLLATCYYRSGRINEAHAVLKDRGCGTPQNRFLMAKCCQDLNRLPECESVLSGDSSNKRKGMTTTDQVTEDFSDSAPFALRVLSAVYGATERHAAAADCDRKALSLNPLLWGAFQALCDKGQTPDPEKCFSTGHLDSLDHVHGVNNILCLFNKIASSSSSPPSSSSNNAPSAVPATTTAVTVTSTPNLPAVGSHAHHPSTATPILPQIATPAVPAQMVTPVNVDQTATPMDTTVDTTPRSSMTQSSRMMSGIGALNFSLDSNASSTVDSNKPAPAPSSTSNFLAPPMMMRKRIRGVGAADGGSHEHHQPHSNLTPASSIVQRLSADSSLCTPTFGILPRQTTLAPKPPPGEGGGGPGPSVALKLDFSSPSLSVLSPCLTGPLDVPVQPLDKAPVKQKRSSVASKENPLKPNLAFGQSGNVANQNVTPSVRRSSRLFGSTQSVKENSKQQAPKKTNKNNPKSPSSRRPKGRIALAAHQEAEKNERNKVQDKDKLAKDLMDIDDTKKPSPPPHQQQQPQPDTHQQAMAASLSGINLGAHALVIQKSSLEGLLQLLRQLGAGYVELSNYNCRKALEIIDSTVPHNHKSTGWVLGMQGKAHFELAEYKEAKDFFKEVHELEPFRMDFMEYYSTALWHLQEDVELSSLAQDLTKASKKSPEAWIAAGNCFSHLKEHENAIKFFQRAVQVEPSFAYAYTLLGHEYVMIEELEKALACFRSAVRMDPRHYNAWYGVGLTYYKQERYQLADVYYRKALKINKNNPILMCHVAVVQHAMQKTDRALDTLATAIEHSPKNSLCKFERASILYAAERYHEALQELNELKELVPKESPVYFLLGKVHNKLNNTHLALMHFSWAMDLDPKGANTQIKDALDPTLNRASQEMQMQPRDDDEDDEDDNNSQEELMQVGGQEDEDNEANMSESFNPPGVASASQESSLELFNGSSVMMEDDSTAAIVEEEAEVEEGGDGEEEEEEEVASTAAAPSFSHQDSMMPRAEVTPPPPTAATTAAPESTTNTGDLSSQPQHSQDSTLHNSSDDSL